MNGDKTITFDEYELSMLKLYLEIVGMYYHGRAGGDVSDAARRFAAEHKNNIEQLREKLGYIDDGE